MHEKDDKGIIEKLEVTVIPVDDEPYSKIINITPAMISKSTMRADHFLDGSNSHSPGTVSGSSQLHAH